MFSINEQHLQKETKESGVTSLRYFEGMCSTCENYKEDKNCEHNSFFEIEFYISKMNSFISKRKVCRNWCLRSDILTAFKRNILGPNVNIIPLTQNYPNNKHKKFMK